MRRLCDVFAAKRAKDCLKRGIVTHQRIQRHAIKMPIKSFCCIADGKTQTASLLQGAGVIQIGKALRQRHFAFKLAKNIADHDLSRRTRQPEATISAPLGVQKAALSKTVYHLGKMVFRGIARPRNIAFGDKPARIDSTKHENSDRNIGPFGDAHEGPPEAKLHLTYIIKTQNHLT